jgi:hypothetical protein
MLQAMARRNQGPRLRWLDKRKRFYVTWTERGRSREFSTGTADREEAEAAFAAWMRVKDCRLPPGASENVRGMPAAEPQPGELSLEVLRRHGFITTR